MVEVKVVCCYSTRSCKDYYTGVIDIFKKTLEIHKAVRCYRGEEKILRITEQERYIVFHDMKSFRGRHNIVLVHKPSALTEQEALRIIRHMLGLIEVEVI